MKTAANGHTQRARLAVINPIVNDTLFEGTETVVVRLAAGNGYSLGTPHEGTVSIMDDDPVPSLSVSDVAVTEGNSGTANAVFTVTLSAPSYQTITVSYQTVDGTASAGADYVYTAGAGDESQAQFR